MAINIVQYHQQVQYKIRSTTDYQELPNINSHEYIHSIGRKGVHTSSNFYIQTRYKDFNYSYVINATDDERLNAWAWADSTIGRPYQFSTYRGWPPKFYGVDMCNYNLYDDPPDPLAGRIQCAELVWAGYMNVTNGMINICDQSHYVNQSLSETWWRMVTGPSIWDCDLDPDNNPEVDCFSPDNPPFSQSYNIATADCSQPSNDPDNFIWTTIQEAVDNLSAFDTLIIKSGTYSEDIDIDKSLIINGEDRETTIIEGSITMSNTFDYELPELGDSDWNKFVNMTGNEVLLHFNNETDVGENYSSLSLVYDHTGRGNNGASNYVTWNTSSALKGAGAFDFDGINDYINLSTVSALAGENVTVSSWIYWNGGSREVDPIISQLDSQNNGYCLYINSSTNRPVFRLNDTEAISSIEVDSGWHNIVGTHNKTTLKIYMDGNLINTASKDGLGISSEAFVGFDNISSYFKGTIDEIAVWNRTLSDDEIARLYKLSYGISISDLTIKNSTIGVSLYNCSEIYNCNLINHTIGINVDNKTSVFIYNVSFTDCDKGIQIDNSHPVIYDDCRELILVGKCNITASTGISVNSSSNMGIVLSYFNCSNINLEFNDCDISTIGVENCTSFNNSSPDTPSLTGPTLGDPNIVYTYYSCTNDSDNDQMWYQFDWDDGNTTDWLGPYMSNATVNASYSWANEGGYYVRVKAKDVFFNESRTYSIYCSYTPTVPEKPTLWGPLTITEDIAYTYNASTIDPDGNASLYYQFDWGDDSELSDWIGPFASGATCNNATHTWTEQGYYDIKVRAKDESGDISCWSDPLSIVVPFNDDPEYPQIGISPSIHNIEDFQLEEISIGELNIGDDVIKSVSDVIDSASEVIDVQYRYGAKIKNVGSTDIEGYLRTIVHYFDQTSEQWVTVDDPVNETTPRTINSGKHLALGPIFKGRVHTKALTNGNGNYRVYAVFGDSDGNVLMCDDDTYLVVKCEFTVTGL